MGQCMRGLMGAAASAAPRKVSEHLAAGAAVGALLVSEQVAAGAAIGAQVAQLGTALLSEQLAAAGTAAGSQVAHFSATLEFERARIDSIRDKIRVDLTHGPRDESRCVE